MTRRMGMSLMCLFAAANLFAQQIVKVWDKRFGGSDDDDARFIQQTTDGGYIIVGSSASNAEGDKSETSRGCNDYWLVRVDSWGNKVWDKRFGGSDNDEARFIQQTADGGYIIAGHSLSRVSGDKSEASWGGRDYWLVKVDSAGNKVWDKRFGGSDEDVVESAQGVAGGGYIIAGASYSGADGDKSDGCRGGNDFWLVKVGEAGNKIWDKRFGGSSYDCPFFCAETADGGYIIGGSSCSGANGDKSEECRGCFDYWLVKVDGAGNKVWDKRFGGSGDDHGYSVWQTADGGYIVAGCSNSGADGDKSEPSRGGYDYWLVKVDDAGNKVWDKRFGGSGDDGAYSVQSTTDGGYIIVGYSSSGADGDKSEASRGGYDYWIVKVDSSGNKVWDKRFGGSGNDYARSVQPPVDGGYVVVGRSYSYPYSSGADGDKSETSRGGYDYWLVKFKLADDSSPSETDGAGTIMLTGGALADQNLGSNAWEINVSAGSAINGTVSCRTVNRMGANAVAPFGYTWTWGNRQSDIRTVDSWISTGTQTWQVAINLTAPTTPGIYYILFGFGGEYNMSQVLSCDNWSAGGSVIWNDGNDYFDLDADRLQFAHANGYVQDWPYRTDVNTYEAKDIPVMPIKVNVSSSGGNYWAVLVGVDTYNDATANSKTFVNDAMCIQKLLENDSSRWQSVVAFTNYNGTKSSIRLYLNSLTNYVQAGDVLLYMHSSHGGYENDTTYVYCYPSSAYEIDSRYTDEELGNDLAMFNPDAKIIVLLESCFSGGMCETARGWPFVERTMNAYCKSRLGRIRSKQNINIKSLSQNIVFMTSSKNDQSSYGFKDGLSWYINGFSYATVAPSADTTGDGVLQFSELHAYAANHVGRMLEYYWSKGKFYQQTPQIYPENSTIPASTDALTAASPGASIIIIDLNGNIESAVKQRHTIVRSNDSFIDTAFVTVCLQPGSYANIAADWWVVAYSSIGCFYLDASMQWQPFDGNPSNCRPVYQGPLFDLPMTPVLDYKLPIGQYTFYFAVDRLDGVINLDQIWYDYVSLTVE